MFKMLENDVRTPYLKVVQQISYQQCLRPISEPFYPISHCYFNQRYQEWPNVYQLVAGYQYSTRSFLSGDYALIPSESSLPQAPGIEHSSLLMPQHSSANRINVVKSLLPDDLPRFERESSRQTRTHHQSKASRHGEAERAMIQSDNPYGIYTILFSK